MFRLFLVQGIKSFGLLFYNSITALPLATLLGIFNGELPQFLAFPHFFEPVSPRLHWFACGVATWPTHNTSV